jgi:serine/threonine-protein kinase RsbW
MQRSQATHRIQQADFMAVRHALQSLFAQEPLRSLNDEMRAAAEIIIAEALNNIVEHAYASQSGAIEISVDLGADGLNCTISDHGIAMPGHSLPLGKAAQITTIADLPEGGFGWFLIRALAQDLCYSRTRGENFLRFRLPVHKQVA